MPILEKGCLCCALDTCVKVQGFILTGAFVVIAVVDLVMLTAWLVPLEQNPSPHSDDFDKRAISTTKAACIALLVCLIVWVVLGILLLYGVYKRKRLLMWPYMVVGVMNLLITTGLLVFYASSVNAQIPNMFILICILGLQLWLILHVVSLYQKFGVEERANYEQQQQEEPEE